MDPFARLNGHRTRTTWQIEDLEPTPEEEWARLQRFVGLGPSDRSAMLATVEPLFRRGAELVVGTYDYLLQNRETAAVLGWEKGADSVHLAERRRFFTLWLARLLGMDFSDDLARYLFHAGKLHAAHGPRGIHVAPAYVIGSISLVNAAFARFLMEEMPGEAIVPAALAAWNKVLSLHLHLMLMGYHAARAFDEGDLAVQVTLFGKMRTVTGAHRLALHLNDGAPMRIALQKLFNYFPAAQGEVFDLEWLDGERIDASGTPWFEARKSYRIKPMWRVLLNGKDLSYIGGPKTPVSAGDQIHIFPPGR